MSNSVGPQRWQPTRLHHPWDSPGKNTGVGAIAFSNAWKWKVKVKLLSHFRLLATPWTTANQDPPCMGFSRQEYWSRLPLPSPASGLTSSLLQNHKIVYALTVLSLVSQSYVTFCNPMDCTQPGSSVHGVLQARVLKCVVIPSSRGTSRPRNQIQVSHIANGFITIWATKESLTNMLWLVAY